MYLKYQNFLGKQVLYKTPLIVENVPIWQVEREENGTAMTFYLLQI